uniref:Uncharacterized protein n=2 Tax=Oryza sativa subsp. japonica TaxID=39947 RepID=Q2R6P6_ORYSJ|nr:hypothetical protein LOC_Os11g19320 [Oryza sativa Japonica Group]ABA92844.1 hypothetical protein LOC_Os11g19320 [Oryza sativa Japonica Group]
MEEAVVDLEAGSSGSVAEEAAVDLEPVGMEGDGGGREARAWRRRRRWIMNRGAWREAVAVGRRWLGGEGGGVGGGGGGGGAGGGGSREQTTKPDADGTHP